MSFRSSVRYNRHFPPNWSPAKEGLYWREWSAVVRYCKAHEWPIPDRHDLHVKALGEDKSHTAFTNQNFDDILREFRAISRPADLNAQLKALNGRKVRLCFGIRRLAAKMKKPEAYLIEIAKKQTDRVVKALENLDEEELEAVRIALAQQYRRGQRAAKAEKATAEQPF